MSLKRGERAFRMPVMIASAFFCMASSSISVSKNAPSCVNLFMEAFFLPGVFSQTHYPAFEGFFFCPNLCPNISSCRCKKKWIVVKY
jgi:hypothetical protein